MRVRWGQTASSATGSVTATAAWRVRILVATFVAANVTMILFTVLEGTALGGALIEDLKLLCQIQ